MSPGPHLPNAGCSTPRPPRAGGSSAAALRQLLAERFPASVRASDDTLATGITPIDEISGGLPRPGLTELVCSAPSCGSQLLLGQLLLVTREQSLRVALVDRHDSFDPGSWPPFLLHHLLWVRPRHSEEALAAADLLARDANLGLVILDLHHAPAPELRRLKSTAWYRLQRAIEPTRLAGLVITPFALVPSARLRLELTKPHPLSVQHQPRPQLTSTLAPEFLRQRTLLAHACSQRGDIREVGAELARSSCA